VGTFGDIGFYPGVNGVVRARAYYRDWDGVCRLVQTAGSTQAMAERALKIRLQARAADRPVDTTLTPDSTFAQLAEYWLADLKLEGRPSEGTMDVYAWNINHLARNRMASCRRSSR
jgi:hypothetical protein